MLTEKNTYYRIAVIGSNSFLAKGFIKLYNKNHDLKQFGKKPNPNYSNINFKKFYFKIIIKF